MGVTDFRSIDDAMYDAAAAWHACLAGDVREADWLAFTAWLETDPHHRLAFDAVSHASAEIDAQKALLATAPVNAEKSRPQVDSFVEQQPPMSPAFMPRLSRRLWLAGTAVAAAGLLAAVLIQRPQPSESSLEKLFATRVGERQTLKLEDGSEVQLNTDTKLTISFKADVRQARLEKGEAHFDVAYDAARPFVVTLGDRRVDVLGTAFNVARTDGKLTVTVARGIVQVGPREETVESAAKLTAGDQYRAQEGQPVFDVVKVDPEAALAWRDGRLIFDNAPLFQVISDLNRYYDQKLVIDDTATGNLLFSGILKLDDAATVARRLEGLLPIAVQRRDNDLVLGLRPSD